MTSINATLHDSTAISERKKSMTKEQATQMLISHLHSSMGRVDQSWSAVGMEEDARNRRIGNIAGYVKAYIEDIVRTEEEAVHQVAEQIVEHRVRVADLRDLLRMDPFDESAYPDGTIPLMKAFEQEIASLSKQKEVRMFDQATLFKQYKKLCRRADIEMDDELFASIATAIYSEADLRELRRAVSSLQETLIERLMKINHLQAENKKICDTIGSSCCLPDADQKFLDVDFSSSAVVLSEEAVHRSENLNRLLKEEHDKWMEGVAVRYDDLLTKVESLSKKCCRGTFYLPNTDGQSEKNLRTLEEHHEELQEKYERGGPIYDKLAEWMSLWKERLNAEQRACRTSFYHNRGGSLNTTLKRQRLLQVQIPKVFNELSQMCEDYAYKYDIRDILVDSLRPDRYVQAIIEEYERDKEMVRVQKQLDRGANNNPMANSAKKRQTPKQVLAPRKVPATTIAKRKRSLSCSEISMITPVNVQVPGPMTSTPIKRALDFSGKKTPQKQPPASSKDNTLKSAKSVEKPRQQSSQKPNRPWF